MDRTSTVVVSVAVVFMGAMVWKGVQEPRAPAGFVERANRAPVTTTKLTNTQVVGPIDTPIVERPRSAPLSLTASDGTGLTLTSLVARAEVQDPLAFTELRLTFQNPQARQLEGTFRITLPEGASVSRFAMKIDNRWQEGEVVEKQAARVAYEDFLHRKQDPALLEQAAGNEFSARVFPIPPRGTKEIILSYSQEVSGGARYSLPLRGLPELGLVSISVTQDGFPQPVQTFSQRRFLPDGDFVLDERLASKGLGLRARNMVLAKVKADAIASQEKDPIESAIVLVDTSASRALGYEEQVRLVGSLLRSLGERADATLRVAAFDQTVVPIFAGKAREFGDKEATVLRERMPLGASNLAGALTWATDEAAKAKATRVILVGDGVATAGPTEGEAFAAVLSKLKAAGIVRVDAVAVGGIRDRVMMKRLVAGSFAKDGMVIDGSLGVANAMRRLTERTLSEVPIDVPGARWFWPKRMEGVQAGDEVLVYADVPEGQAFSLSAGKPLAMPELATAEVPLLERAWVQAKIQSLVEAQSREPSPERTKEILDLSINHRVLSPYTALLVLETEADYARFKIDRKALKDILTMDSGTLKLKHRSWPFDRNADEDKQELARNSDNKEGGSGTRAKAEEGAMGNPRSPAAQRFGVRGPSDNRDPEVPTSGAATATAAATPPPAPVQAPGAPPAASPAPAMAAEPLADRAARPAPRGGPAAEQESFGAGGLGLSGAGEGGGGRGEGIGLGNIGTVGHGAGVGTGQGFGSGSGRLGGNHRTQTPALRSGVVVVNGGLPTEVVQRIVRQNFGRLRLCYENGLRANPALEGRVVTRFVIDKSGAVLTTSDGGSDLPDAAVVACVVRSFASLSFPQPEGSVVTVVFPVSFSPGGGETSTTSTPSPNNWNANTVAPYTGKFKTVMNTIASQGAKAALPIALEWRKADPADVLALIALGETYEGLADTTEAARAYGSLIDLFASRADLRRFAGERLERVTSRRDGKVEPFGEAMALAVDTYEKAVLQRPDHPASHRLLAFARLKRGDHPGAFDAALSGARRSYPSGRFAGVDRILREDLGLIAAAWLAKDPSKRAEIMAQLAEVRATLETGASLRFVLNWETDANDVDFHIMDSRGGHAYYGAKSLPSGGELYADVTTGYGPECFTVRRPVGQRAGPYKLQAHYYSRGPMGYGMGKLEIIDHDGKGGLTFEERPYVVMVDRAFLDLGVVDAK